MKKTILFIFLLVSSLSFAQKKGITYQAVIYNPKMGQLPGQNDKLSPLANASICMSFEIDDLNSSTPAYRETIKTTTDTYGMVNLIIGSGSSGGGSATSFQAIMWNENIGDLIVSVDLAGTCTKFVQISKQPFTAVPFSLAAGISDASAGSEVYSNKSNDIDVDGDSEIKYPSVKAVKEYVDNSMFVATADASTSLKGLIQLNGDLAGTAALPTVPGLLTKENASNKSIDLSLDATSNVKYPSVKSVKTYVDTQVASATIVDANSTTKGKIQLAGDLAGTAAAPKVPGLLLKANSASPTFTGIVTGIDKVMVGLANVNNTTDLNKPISTVQQTALGLKAPLASPAFTGTVTGIDKAMVGLANVNNTTDLNKPISTVQQTALDLKAPLASPAFTGTVSGIDKTMVGLGNVNNTADADKVISIAASAALDLKEATANKSIDLATDAASDVKYPSVKSVKTYVDGLVGTASNAVSINTNTTLNLGNSIVYCSGAFTVTLPVAASAPGKVYFFSKTDEANTVLTFSESIYLTANSSFTQLNYPKSFRIQSENGKWMILN
jgi:hypothetical protein